MRDDSFDLIGIVTEFLQSGFHRLVDNFEHSAARQQLVFYQGNVRFDSSRVAIHQETDRAGRCEHSDLCVPITITLSKFRRAVPDLRGFLFQVCEFLCVRDFAHRLAMQLDHFQHRRDVVLGDWLRHAAGACVAVT